MEQKDIKKDAFNDPPLKSKQPFNWHIIILSCSPYSKNLLTTNNKIKLIQSNALVV